MKSAIGTTAQNRVPFFALLSANAISWTGNIMAAVAVPWFVLQTTGSPVKTGLTAFFEALPVVIAAFFGGAIVDRLGHKRVSIIADIASGLAVALIPLLYSTIGLAFWQLLGLVFLSALFNIPGGTARGTLLPELIDRAGIRPERANSAYQAVPRLAILLGPPLAAVLIVAIGPSNVLWFDAATFAASAAIVGIGVRVSSAPLRSSRPYLAEVMEGVRFIRRDRLLLSIAIAYATSNFLDSAFFAVTLPVYVKETFGSPMNLGLILTASGAGALAGTIIVGAIGHRLPRRMTFIAAFLGVGIYCSVLATLPPLAVIVVVMAVGSLAAGPIDPIGMTIFQGRTPIALRGRVFGALTAIAKIAVPAGMLLGGFLIEHGGVRASIVVMAVGFLILALGLMFNPALRDMDAPATTVDDQGVALVEGVSS